MNEFYPRTITSLTEADIPFKGVKGWLSQGPDRQIVFFEIEAIGQEKTCFMDFFAEKERYKTK